MKRRIVTALLARTASGVLLASTTNSAYADTPPHEPACSSNMCTWTKARYKGTESESGLNKGVCYLSVRVGSFVNKKRYNVRFYPDKNCASSRHFEDTWGYFDLQAETGWPVWSYKRV